MGEKVTAQLPVIPPHLHPDLANVALVDGKTAAAVGGARISWWLAKVASGDAPEAAVRRPRFTRWRVADVAAFWRDFAAAADPEIGAAMVENATKASAAAQAKKRKAPAAGSTWTAASARLER